MECSWLVYRLARWLVPLTYTVSRGGRGLAGGFSIYENEVQHSACSVSRRDAEERSVFSIYDRGAEDVLGINMILYVISKCWHIPNSGMVS